MLERSKFLEYDLGQFFDSSHHLVPHLCSLLLYSSAARGRVYLPQDELAQFGLCDDDVFARKITDQWRKFMKEQISRARCYFNLAEEGASQLDKDSRWPVCSIFFNHSTFTSPTRSFQILENNHFS